MLSCMLMKCAEEVCGVHGRDGGEDMKTFSHTCMDTCQGQECSLACLQFTMRVFTMGGPSACRTSQASLWKSSEEKVRVKCQFSFPGKLSVIVHIA